MSNSWTYRYDTGWVACSDWTNVHLGTTLDGNVTHNLNAPLPDLLVKVFVSTDGTDANSYELPLMTDVGSDIGITVFQVDLNNVKVQTGSGGAGGVTSDAGAMATLDTEAYYYKVKVWYLG